MGYLFLVISLLCGATKGYCGKRTSGFVNSYKDAMAANTLRMLLCIAIGLIMILASGSAAALKINSTVFWITLLSGTASSAFVVLWLVSVKKGAYMMLDVFCMIGILIPLIGSAVWFDESICLNHVIGLLILIGAVFIMCSYNNSIKQKMTVSSFILLLLCGISNGLSDFSQKLFINLSNGGSIAVFNVYTYLVSAVILGVCYFIFAARSADKTPVPIRPVAVYVAIMSVCLFAYSYFKTLAAGYLSSVELYPLAQGGGLILSTVMSAVLFHEKLTAKCIVGILLSFAALIVINVL